MTPTAEDMRRHRRVPGGRRSARVLIDGSWFNGSLIDISGGGAALDIEGPAGIGARVVLSDTELGLISGTVVRRREEGPALAFDLDEKRRTALIDTLTLWHNEALFA